MELRRKYIWRASMQAGVLRLVHYGSGQHTDSLGPRAPNPLYLVYQHCHTSIPLPVSVLPVIPHVVAGPCSRLLHPPFESSYMIPDYSSIGFPRLPTTRLACFGFWHDRSGFASCLMRVLRCSGVCFSSRVLRCDDRSLSVGSRHASASRGRVHA